jgi:hypothetical protein
VQQQKDNTNGVVDMQKKQREKIAAALQHLMYTTKIVRR